MPVVNQALSVMPGAPHYGRGTRCITTQFKPDWSVVLESKVEGNGRYVNLLPGDTKLSSKWTPRMIEDGAHFYEWQKVVSQVVSYAARESVHYGFIITDSVVVVLRITLEYSGEGMAADRPQRWASSGPLGDRSQESDTTVMPSDPTIPSQSSSEPYHDNDPLCWDYHVQHHVIPWSNHGQQLTGKLALWALAMMAVHGKISIDYSYPGLDTWREGEGVELFTTPQVQPRRGQPGRIRIQIVLSNSPTPIGAPSWNRQQEGAVVGIKMQRAVRMQRVMRMHSTFVSVFSDCTTFIARMIALFL